MIIARAIRLTSCFILHSWRLALAREVLHGTGHARRRSSPSPRAATGDSSPTQEASTPLSSSPTSPTEWFLRSRKAWSPWRCSPPQRCCTKVNPRSTAAPRSSSTTAGKGSSPRSGMRSGTSGAGSGSGRRTSRVRRRVSREFIFIFILFSRSGDLNDVVFCLFTGSRFSRWRTSVCRVR